MLHDHLRHDVQEELRYEPRVDDLAIAVAAEDDEVTLRGTVGSFHERREAVHATKRVFGVNKIHDRLYVRLLDTDRRDDADHRGAALQALMRDSLVPSTIDARAKDAPTPADVRHYIDKAFTRDARVDAEALSIDTDENTVTLSGHVRSWVEHDAAINAAWSAPGVVDVDDRIVVEH